MTLPVLTPEAPVDAASFYPALRLLIGDTWVHGGERVLRDVVDPCTGACIGRLPLAGADDVSNAIAAARRAFDGWRRQAPAARGAVLVRAAGLLRQRTQTIARVITLELGKPLAESVVEVERLAGVFEWHAAEAQRVYGRQIPGAEGIRNVVIREPVGVVAAFSPWNGPAASPGRKISAAIAAGCAVIVKPAEETPGTALAVAECLVDAGLPPGVLNVVFGEPGAISTQLIESPVVRAVTFTGSVPVGRHLAALAGTHLKPCVLELGGHAPVVVCEDTDVDAVAALCARRKYLNAGQICMAPTRFYVQRPILERFTAAFVDATRAIRIGSGFHPASQMGPLAHERRRRAVEHLVDQAVDRGARVLTGGERPDSTGFYYAPTVLDTIGEGVTAMKEEPFGPIAMLLPFDTLDDAIAAANDTPYGLAAYGFTQSAARADRLLRELESGVVSVNHFMGAGDSTPFGGVKDSGYGREGGAECFDGYLASKLASHALR